MAAEELEYESDPEEAKLSLKMRRKVASDDEDEGEGRPKPPRMVDSDIESDGQGAAPADYDDEEEEEEYLEEEEEELEEEEEEEEYEDEELEHRDGDGVVPGGSPEIRRMVMEGEERGEGNQDGERLGMAESTEADGRGFNGLDEKGDGAINNNQQQREEEEKKENEPYAVPTAGGFYMHDDRFRDNAAGRHRRTLGGRKVWESKDERKWGHDKFEELTSQERQYEDGKKSSRGRIRGPGRSRGAFREYSQGSRPKTYANNDIQKTIDDPHDAPKSVRGRGPRRYHPSYKNNNDAPAVQKKEAGKSIEKPSRTSSGRATARTSNVESNTAPAKKLVFASSLNSASPPFYPSSSSSKDIAATQKNDVQTGTVNRNGQAPVLDETFPVKKSNRVTRGKNTVDSTGMDKLYINDTAPGVTGKPSTTMQFTTSGSSSFQSSQSQLLPAQGRGLNTLPQTYQPSVVSNIGNGASPPTQLHTVQRNPVQSQVQPSSQVSSQQFANRSGSASQDLSPPKATVATDSLESGELGSPSESSNSNSGLVGKGKVNVQGSGRGLFLYGGTQVMGSSGSMNSGHGEQNFHGTPTFLPVMQLGGQHPGGIGVPAVGMAFPGYVGNPQLGMGNSEMTWLPVLAGAAGALGAAYCSPYISVDGAFNARPSGQASAVTFAPSKENTANKPSSEWKPSQRPAELPNDYPGQRQKNPRRYTEMKFGQ